MYAISDDDLIDEVEVDSLPTEAGKKVAEAITTLRTDYRPAFYHCQRQRDGSFQIAIPIGIRRMLLGYDVKEKRHIIFLNYLKWDWFREAIDWTIGLLGNEPGGKR
jgi:hypothetical protein